MNLEDVIDSYNLAKQLRENAIGDLYHLWFTGKVTYTEIGDRLGISRQAARQLIIHRVNKMYA